MKLGNILGSASYSAMRAIFQNYRTAESNVITLSCSCHRSTRNVSRHIFESVNVSDAQITLHSILFFGLLNNGMKLKIDTSWQRQCFDLLAFHVISSCSTTRGWLNPPLRYHDEPCRHKVLDLVGDFSLLAHNGNQGLLNAHIIAYKVCPFHVNALTFNCSYEC